MIVWYLIISMSQGSLAIPQVDHKQCLANRHIAIQARAARSTSCVPGAPGFVVSSGFKEEDD